MVRLVGLRLALVLLDTKVPEVSLSVYLPGFPTTLRLG